MRDAIISKLRDFESVLAARAMPLARGVWEHQVTVRLRHAALARYRGLHATLVAELDLIAGNPSILAANTSYRQLVAYIDAELDPRLSARAGMVASATLHMLVLLTILMWYWLATGGGTDSLQAVSVDVITLDTASDATASGRAFPARQQSQAALLESVQIAPEKLEAALEKQTLPVLDAETASTTQSQEMAADSASQDSDKAVVTGSGSAGPPKPGSSGIDGRAGASPGSSPDSLQDQFTRCWSGEGIFAGAQIAAVSFQVFLNADGSVAHPPEMTAASIVASAGDPRVKAAADAAMRALYICAPYRIAGAGKAGRSVTVTFDPKQAVSDDGQ
jgi:hypothetical protein